MSSTADQWERPREEMVELHGVRHRGQEPDLSRRGCQLPVNGFRLYPPDMIRPLSLLMLFVVPLHAADSIAGRVVAIADGDTFTILDSSKTQHKIRLHGIDAPEKGQPFGTKAKEHLSDLVFGKDVIVTVMDTDRYGRTVGKLTVAGVAVNTKMVRDGFAWRYVTYAEAEADARAYGPTSRQCRRGELREAGRDSDGRRRP